MTTLPDSYARTRESLHRLAVYVISPARSQFNPRHVALRATPGGFGTAPFGPADTVLRVEGDALVREQGDATAREPISTLAAAGRLAGIAPAVDLQERFDVPPHGDLDAPLAVDAASATILGDWLALATDVLDEIRGEARAEDDVTAMRIWPEHFDAAIELGPEGRRGTYGASTGDRHHAGPYLYATIWSGPPEDPFWNAVGFRGAWRLYEERASDEDPRAFALEFYRAARLRALGY